MDASISLDPLIAEAKRRTQRRRAMVLALAVLAGAAALTLALRPWGGAPAGHVSLGAGGNPALSRLHVPMDAGERQWRSLLPPLEGAVAAPSAIRAARVEVARMLKAAGVTLVRIKIWRRTSPPAVELVVATNTDSAIFTHHRFMQLVGLARPDYVRVVDAHGSMTFEWGGAANEGFVGSAPALAGCIAGMHGGLGVRTPPCPVK